VDSAVLTLHYQLSAIGVKLLNSIEGAKKARVSIQQQPSLQFSPLLPPLLFLLAQNPPVVLLLKGAFPISTSIQPSIKRYWQLRGKNTFIEE
jgi:hypothetical protein